MDATGNNRTLIGDKQFFSKKPYDRLLVGSGIEWILQVDRKNFKSWKNRITFFLGTKWIKNG